MDGIHFDDYFYPYPVDGVDFPDSATYGEYVSAGGTLAIDDWRRDNVNRMVEGCWGMIQQLNTALGKNVSAVAVYAHHHVIKAHKWRNLYAKCSCIWISMTTTLAAPARSWHVFFVQRLKVEIKRLFSGEIQHQPVRNLPPRSPGRHARPHRRP